MIFQKIELAGAWLIDLDRHEDERGFFARSWCAHEFAEHGLEPHLAQCNVSFNRLRGTLRGMHFQVAPHEEVKLVRVTQGAAYDVILDLRPDSPTFMSWYGIELSADNRRAIYIPRGIAHGFQTLQNNTEVFYQMSIPFAPECARGVRWNDATFAIHWPIDVPIVSERDRSYGDFSMLLKSTVTP